MGAGETASTAMKAISSSAVQPKQARTPLAAHPDRVVVVRTSPMTRMAMAAVKRARPFQSGPCTGWSTVASSGPVGTLSRMLKAPTTSATAEVGTSIRKIHRQPR